MKRAFNKYIAIPFVFTVAAPFAVVGWRTGLIISALIEGYKKGSFTNG